LNSSTNQNKSHFSYQKKQSIQLRLHPVDSLIEALPKLKKINKEEKHNKTNETNNKNTTTETEPIFLYTKKPPERTSWSVEMLRSATPWPFRCTGHPKVSHKHPRP